ncbi:WW domain binding protein 11-domain-containing protein [Phycomyces blakesleeanus]
MGKAKKSINPADAARKAQRKREIKKNKDDRKRARENALSKKDTGRTKQEIARLENLARLKQLDKNGQTRLATLKEDVEKIEKAKKSQGLTGAAAALAARQKQQQEQHETRKLVYDPKSGAFVPAKVKKRTTTEQVDQGDNSDSGSSSSLSSSSSGSDSDSDTDMSDSDNEGSEKDSDTEDIPLPPGPPPPSSLTGQDLTATSTSTSTSGSGSGPAGGDVNAEDSDDYDLDDIPLPPGPPPPRPFQEQLHPIRQAQAIHQNPFAGHFQPFFGMPGFPNMMIPPPPPPPGRPMFPHMHPVMNQRPHYDPRPNRTHQRPQNRRARQMDPMLKDMQEVEAEELAAELLPIAGATPEPSSSTTAGVYTPAATISAEPQLRNLQKELLGFVPAALRRKQAASRKTASLPKGARPNINAAPEVDGDDGDDE